MFITANGSASFLHPSNVAHQQHHWTVATRALEAPWYLLVYDVTCHRRRRVSQTSLVAWDETLVDMLARIPSAEDNRGNLAAGAKGVGRELNDRDRWLVSQIGPTLRQRGMLFVGLDVIGGYVTEINVTSPTGVRELGKQFGTKIAGLLMDAIEKRLS